MKHVARSWPAILVLSALAGVQALAQDEAGEDPAPSADGQAVDEEEAEFRRRMELEESDEGDRSSRPDLPDIVDVDPVEAPEDRLPPASREHLEEQLTELIIENGRWEPTDAEREATFEPSEAARADPQLAREEAEAWAAMVEAYHEREREAFEATSASPESRRGTGQGTGRESGAAPGPGPGPGSGQGSGQGSGSGQGAVAPTRGSTDADAERAPTGNPFSALEFLGGEASGETSEGETGSRADAGSQRENETPIPATTSPEPDAIDPEALEALFSGQASPDAASSDAASPAREDSPASGPADANDAPPEERASLPPALPQSSPEPSIWDWIRDLFGGGSDDDEPSAG